MQIIRKVLLKHQLVRPYQFRLGVKYILNHFRIRKKWKPLNNGSCREIWMLIFEYLISASRHGNASFETEFLF